MNRWERVLFESDGLCAPPPPPPPPAPPPHHHHQLASPQVLRLRERAHRDVSEWAKYVDRRVTMVTPLTLYRSQGPLDTNAQLVRRGGLVEGGGGGAFNATHARTGQGTGPTP